MIFRNEQMETIQLVLYANLWRRSFHGLSLKRGSDKCGGCDEFGGFDVGFSGFGRFHGYIYIYI